MASALKAKAGVVEVRGVEPRSEEKTLKTSTYLAYLLNFARGNSGRQDAPRAIRSGPACGRISQASLRRRSMLSHLTRRSQGLRWAKNQENGMLNLIKQPVRSCSWHLIVYRFFNVDTETTIRSSELPHPRRIQVTPRVTILRNYVIPRAVAHDNIPIWIEILNASKQACGVPESPPDSSSGAHL